LIKLATITTSEKSIKDEILSFLETQSQKSPYPAVRLETEKSEEV